MGTTPLLGDMRDTAHVGGESKSWPRLKLAAWSALCLSSALAPRVQAQAPHGDLSIPCIACHSTDAWQPLLEPLSFDHATTGFELLGMHGSVDCMTCHEHLVLANIGSACADCHIDAHQGELGFDCGGCHETLSRDPRFGLVQLFHDASLFPLTGAHRALDCSSCHNENPPFEFQLTPIDCYACHRDDLNGAQPDHLAAGFSLECEGCHRTDAWSPADIVTADFDHDVFFPLRGAHSPLDCEACHVDGFAPLPTDCFACHQDDYLSAQDPDHVALALSTSCEACHGTNSWEGATQVDHDLFFPLAGVHAVLDCDSCHEEQFAGTPRDCYSCHQVDYAATEDPDHAASGLGIDCESCHDESSWRVNALDHDPFFPLLGAHGSLDCESCHEEGFTTVTSDCYSCHADVFLSALSPDHVAAGFPLECERCHGSSTWSDGRIDHSFFPHIGGHAGLECTDCHSDVYQGNSAECVACHLDDYDDAGHAADGLPLECELCHDIFDWGSEAIDHSSFPLILGHSGLDCVECHDEGGFEGAPVACFGCHEDDYRSVQDPDHEAAGFPRYCEECHTLADWSQVKFDHDIWYWPIYSGSHATVWDTCATCHPTPFDFGHVECLRCHEHNQPDTDTIHFGVEDYEYETGACLTCHAIL